MAFGMVAISNSQGKPRIDQRVDEAPFPSGDRTDPREANQDRTGRFKPGNRSGAKPKLILTRCAALVSYSPPAEQTQDSVYPRFLRAAGAYRRARCRELATLAGGHVGAGVSALVTSASYALADARYLRHLAMAVETPKERADMLLSAGRLEQNARSSEVAAYELAVRESESRKKSSPDPHRSLADALKEKP